MTQKGTDDKKAAAKAARAAKRAAAANELLNHRRQQLQITQSGVTALEERLQLARRNEALYKALSSHLTGFYEEIDKLAKGKTLLEVTDLVVEQANNIVRDAKAIIKDDVYLDRVKEFVPAGTNPLYPDVLLTLRTVQQSLLRFGTGIADREKHLVRLLHEAKTISIALECYLDGNEEPSKEDVKDRLDPGVLSPTWFKENEYTGEDFFDFDRLDRRNLEEYLSDNGSSGKHE